MLFIHNDMNNTSYQHQWWGSTPFCQFLCYGSFILQELLLRTLNHFYILRVSLQLSCADTGQIWTWGLIGNQCFDCGKNNKTEKIGLVTPISFGRRYYGWMVLPISHTFQIAKCCPVTKGIKRTQTNTFTITICYTTSCRTFTFIYHGKGSTHSSAMQSSKQTVNYPLRIT